MIKAAMGVALLGVLIAGCGTKTITTTTTVTATVRVTASPTTAVVVREPEACTPVVHGADGNVSPVVCPDGNPNSYAQVVLTGVAPEMLSLGQFATTDQVSAAGCEDIKNGSTNPIETSAYQFALALNGWKFGIDPSDGGLWSACQ